MDRISTQKRMQVLLFYLMGYSMDAIVKAVDVSKGSVVNIVKELKEGKYPKFDHVLDQVGHLRELAVKLRKAGRGVSDAVLGIVLYERLQTIGVKPSTLQLWVRLCKERLAAAEYPVEIVIESALKQIEIETETGKTYEEQIEDLEERKKQTKKLELEIKDLEARRSSLKSELERAKKSLLEMRRNKEAERRRLDQKLRQHLDGYRLSMERVNTVLRMVPEALRKEGLSQSETKVVMKRVQKLGGLSKACMEMEKEKVQLESKAKILRQIETSFKSEALKTKRWIEWMREEAETLGSEIALRRNELQRLQGECDSLTKEISSLLGTKVGVQQIQGKIRVLREAKKGLNIEVKTLKEEQERIKADIDLAKRWVGLVEDPKQLDDRAIDKFVEEAVILRQMRTGRLPRRIVDSNGRTLCECRLPPLLRREPVSEETLRKRMIKLFLPLVGEEFIPRRRHETELKKQEEAYQKLIDEQRKIINKYEGTCKDLMSNYDRFRDEKQKLEDENLELRNELSFLKKK